ncbi:MAG: SurA N-terminal domain-containing protein [Thiomargarita sp.]|nr:SurA N-terminal domain-containing protein [Thiomargarita sp.]
MLQNIRDGAQGWLAWLIVIVICIPFAFWGINEYFNPSPKKIIAEVNGVELSEFDFKQQVRQRKQQISSMFQNQSIDLSFMDKEIRKNTLKQMIEEEVLVQTAIDTNMRISTSFLASSIHTISAFQDENVFSQARYEQTLNYQGLTAPAFEWKVRRSLLAEQIREGVLRSTLLTDHEKYARLENQERFISILIIPATRFKEAVTITDAAIEKQYKEHSKQYMTPEKVSIVYVELSQDDVVSTEKVDEEILQKRYKERKTSFTTPVQWKGRHILIEINEDVAEEAATTKAQEILTKIQNGDSFETLAQEFSDDIGSKKLGGDLGWFGPGQMVKPFEAAVQILKVGEISELVQSQFGFHIIKLEAIKPEVIRPFEEVRAELEKDMQTEVVESEFYGQVEQFATLAYEHSDTLEVLTETLNLKSKSTELFSRLGSQEKGSILSHQKVIKTAFSHEILMEGYNSEPIKIGEQHLVVLRLKDHESAQLKPLDQVKDNIIATLTQEKTKADAEIFGQRLMDEIKESGDPNIVIQAYDDLYWSTAQWVTRTDTQHNPTIVSDAFKMGTPSTNKALYQTISLNNGDYALIAVLEVKNGTLPDKEKSNTNKTALQQALGESELTQFILGLKSMAEIQDYYTKVSEE